MYIPVSAQNLKDKKFPQIRLALQGAPGTGKTWSALSFPNPIALDFDGSLTAHAGKNIPVVPFYDAEWMDKVYENGKFKRTIARPDVFPNRKDALLHFLQNEALQFTEEQTMILDSWSAVQLAFDMKMGDSPLLSKQGKDNTFLFWEEKIKYSEILCSYFMSVKCHVVVTFHEDPVRDKTTGQLLDKIGPLMQGGFVKQIKRYFTDFFRCKSEVEKDASAKEKNDPTYLIQVKSDNKFEVKTRLDFRDEKSFIDVTDASMFERIFLKYKPKQFQEGN